VLTMELSAAEPASDINDFARTQIDLLRTTAQELDSLNIGNNFPF